MNYPLLYKLIFSPILLPLSLLYGLCAFLYKTLQQTFSYKSKFPVISVGNFCVGGSGKTPLVIEIAKYLKEKGLSPLIVCKSYKATLKSPSEVYEGSDPLVFGDEAVLIKNSLKGCSVASGPCKSDVIKYFDKFGEDSRVYILDDGAQHHKVFKDIKIHVWDMTRSILDLLPFPIGLSREFWFLGERPTFSILNRFVKNTISSNLVSGETLKASYSVNSISSVFDGEHLKKEFVLISGLGNFNQLKDSVLSFINDKPINMINFIEARDHDDFLWFKPIKNTNYVCTTKDRAKLESKISTHYLYIVESDYDEGFKLSLFKCLDRVLKGII